MSCPRKSSKTPRKLSSGTQLYVIDNGHFPLNLVEAIANQFGGNMRYVEDLSDVVQDLRQQPLPLDIVVVDLSLEETEPLAMIEILRHEQAAVAVIYIDAVTDEDSAISFQVYAHTPYPTRLGEFEIGTEPAA